MWEPTRFVFLYSIGADKTRTTAVDKLLLKGLPRNAPSCVHMHVCDAIFYPFKANSQAAATGRGNSECSMYVDRHDSAAQRQRGRVKARSDAPPEPVVKITRRRVSNLKRRHTPNTHKRDSFSISQTMFKQMRVIRWSRVDIRLHGRQGKGNHVQGPAESLHSR